MKLVTLLILSALAPFAIACAGASDTQTSEADLSKAPMENFRKVHSGLFRGGHPDSSGIAFLKKLRFPMSAFEPAVSDDFDKMMNTIMTDLKDPSLGTIYVHCAHGQDRTGLVIGLERVIDEGWQPKDAFKEMIADGFHTFFIGLDSYFEEKTGYND
jgi:hypothetical protein